jgi:hypothetical protein
MLWLRRLWIIIRILAVLVTVVIVSFVLWAVFIEIAMERGI